jgi:ABC-type transport system substrate-binding protein
VAQVLQAQFAELGVELTINNWDNATHRQHINSDSLNPAYPPGATPAIRTSFCATSSIPPCRVNNRTLLADPAIDAQIDGLVREMD